MDDKFRLKIVTNDNNGMEVEIISLKTETEKGRIEILPNHAAAIMSTIPTITELIDINRKKNYLFTSSGILYITNNNIRFCCDCMNIPEEIDIDRAKAAAERANKRLSENNNIDINRAQRALLRAKARIEIKKYS